VQPWALLARSLDPSADALEVLKILLEKKMLVLTVKSELYYLLALSWKRYF